MSDQPAANSDVHVAIHPSPQPLDNTSVSALVEGVEAKVDAARIATDQLISALQSLMTMASTVLTLRAPAASVSTTTALDYGTHDLDAFATGVHGLLSSVSLATTDVIRSTPTTTEDDATLTTTHTQDQEQENNHSQSTATAPTSSFAANGVSSSPPAAESTSSAASADTAEAPTAHSPEPPSTASAAPSTTINILEALSLEGADRAPQAVALTPTAPSLNAEQGQELERAVALTPTAPSLNAEQGHALERAKAKRGVSRSLLGRFLQFEHGDEAAPLQPNDTETGDQAALRDPTPSPRAHASGNSGPGPHVPVAVHDPNASVSLVEDHVTSETEPLIANASSTTRQEVSEHADQSTRSSSSIPFTSDNRSISFTFEASEDLTAGESSSAHNASAGEAASRGEGEREDDGPDHEQTSYSPHENEAGPASEPYDSVKCPRCGTSPARAANDNMTLEPHFQCTCLCLYLKCCGRDMDDPVMMMTHFEDVERGNTPCADMTQALFLLEMGDRGDELEAAAAETLLSRPSSEASAEASAAAPAAVTLTTEHEPESAASEVFDVMENSTSSNSDEEVASGEGQVDDVESKATTEDDVLPSCSVCDMSEGLYKPKHCQCPPPQATCTNCQLGYASAVLSEGRSGGLQCAGGCGARLTYRDLRDLQADDAMMETFQRLSRRQESIRRIEEGSELMMTVDTSRAKVFWCCNPDCDNLMEVYTDAGESVKCRECEVSQCTLHECRMYRSPGSTQRTCPLCVAGQQDLILGDNIRPCPRCKAPIEKNGGCLHMSCTCGHQYFWCCSREYFDASASHAHFYDAEHNSDTECYRMGRGDWTWTLHH